VRNRDIALLIVTIIVTGISAWICFAPNNQVLGRDVSTRLGLDLRGGTQVLLKAQNPNVTADEMAAAAGVIERRVNGLGVSEAVVQRSGSDRIIVELPGVTNPQQAVDTIRSAGRLEFIDTGGQALPAGTVVRTEGNPNPAALRPTPSPAPTTAPGQPTPTPAPTAAPAEASGPIYKSIAQGKDLDISSVQPRFGGGSTSNLNNPYAVTFAFRGQSAENLARFSSQNIDKPMCIVLDNVVFSCPKIQAALVGGNGEITTATREDAERIYNQLKYGALPVSLDVESSRTVTATLGADSVQASIVAGVVGLLVVVIFMIVYYRLPGVVAVIALLIYTLISFALYRLIPITLTLAGIAGFILSIGLAVDANVLIFARLKEELRRGKSLRTALEAGFVESWPAIRDSNASTLITSIILYMFGNSFGVSIIKGFALTLALGILVSMFTAIVVSRTLLRLILPLDAVQRPWLYAVEDAPGLRRTAGQPALMKESPRHG
jgi:preprotein translocase subunit SecD